MAKKKITLCKEVADYINDVETEKIVACNNVKKLCANVKKAFETENIYTDTEQLAAYIRIGELMFGGLYKWQKFLCALVLCTYKKDGKPRWNRLLDLMARGAGKDGTIAWFSICLTSKYHNVDHYDVDICANNEEQSTRPVKDVIEFLERPELIAKNKKAYHWTLESVKGLVNKGRIRGHTNSPKGKDGLRSGCVILNEIHQYEDYANVNVFTTGLGKVENPRLFMFSTNGDVRDGVLDHYLTQAQPVLDGEVEDNGWLYFICSLDSKEEVDDEINWHKANPSLIYNKALLEETREEYRTWKANPNTLPAFMTKRMNLPERANEKAVVDYDYIKYTNQPLIDLTRKNCVVGIDLSRTTDMCSVSFLFRIKEKRYVINHSWICTHSQDWEKIKVKDQFPKWVEMGLLTIVDDFEINPQLITDYIQSKKSEYNILMVAIDDFRQSIFSRFLNQIGISKENKNLKLVKMIDIAKVVPVMESLLLNSNIACGDNPLMRWAINNTKVVTWKTRNTEESDLGNQIYAKIERHSRKTDPFMSLVAALSVENVIPEQKTIDLSLMRAKTM